MARNPVVSQIITERRQGHPTRQKLFSDLTDCLGRPVVTFFTSFRYPVSIDDTDVEMMEGLLRTLDMENGVAVIISSPGGSGLAAERMINLLRSYSNTGEYWAIVPGKAKSAATMICLGASKILMGPASELGPVDPQIEPYMQQLARYNAGTISHLEAERDLATDMAIRCLHTGMLSEHSRSAIESKMEVFLHPKHTKTHGRPIYSREAADCGLNVDVVDHNSYPWATIYELYLRSSEFVSHQAAKAIETEEGAFFMPLPKQQDVEHE